MSGNENKRRIMESHIFAGNDEPEPRHVRPAGQSPSHLGNLPPPPQQYSTPNRNQQTPPRQNYNIPDYEPLHVNRSPNPHRSPQQAPMDNSRFQLCTPHSSRFADNTVVSRPAPQTFDGLIVTSGVPELSPFPTISFDAPEIPSSFEFNVKPLTAQKNRTPKQLKIETTNETMKKMRDELQQDSAQFSARIKSIKSRENEIM